MARAAAQAETQRLMAQAAQERASLEAARAAAEAQQRAAQSDAEKARLAADEANRLRLQSEQEKAALKEQLRQQLNMVLETRSTARGLIVQMNDVLFDTAKYTLRPAAREKLAKIAGILLAHPSLKMEVEGHTDSVGGDDYNQRLSEQRAATVRDYLVQNGISMNSVSALGFGKTRPIASNDTAAGRQQNRRVELVVSGEEIGTSSTTMTLRP
jgi:outer membrane protein OmpA-like peptidoglycan-associated protein